MLPLARNLRSLGLKNYKNLYILSQFYSKTVDDVSWSLGKKERPVNSRQTTESWIKKPEHFDPHEIDPKDREHQYPYKREDGAIQYFNFSYYPRSEDIEDPPVTPTPLFLVYRTNRIAYRPYWEKNILKRLGLGGRKNTESAVCKNTPEINAMLWQVKHLVKILPLNLPENIKEDRNPLHYFIQENGEVVYNPSTSVEESDLEPQDFETKYDRDWVNDQTRKIYHNSLKVEF